MQRGVYDEIEPQSPKEETQMQNVTEGLAFLDWKYHLKNIIKYLVIICFFAGYKKSKGLFVFSRRSLLYAILFSCLYVASILAISSTAVGEDAFREFVFGVSLEPFILLLFYPLVIAVS